MNPVPFEFELPEAWTTASIGDVKTRIQYGTSTRPTEDSSGVPILRMGNIQDGALDLSSLKFVAGTVEGLDGLLLEEGDILFNRTNSPELVGKAAVFRQTRRFTFASYIIRLSVDETVALPEYVCWWINSPWGKHWARHVRTDGVSQSNINSTKLLSMPLPIPPLNEQRRIVAAVERHLESVTSARERLERVPTTIKLFRQAVLSAACSGRLTTNWRQANPQEAGEGETLEEAPIEGLVVPSSWKWQRSKDAFSFVTSGSRGWAKYYADSGATFLRVGNLDHETIKLDMRSVQRVNPPSGAEGARTRVKEGDVLITITAEPGMVALVDTDIGEAYVNQHVALARPTGRLDPRFLSYFLAARTTGQVQFEASQRGATKLGLGLDDIRSLWIASPPPDEQREIVARIEELLAFADCIEQRAKSALQRVVLLPQAILAKAFRGELVPTEAELARRENRSYVPASEVLARLSASVNGEAKTKRPRARKSSKRSSAPDETLLEFME